jgi:hypothetical protein
LKRFFCCDILSAMKNLLVLVLLLATALTAQELKLNSHLDYNTDSQDGPLITGTDGSGLVKGKVNYIFIFEEG